MLNNFQSIFRRFEKKYIITEEQYEQLMLKTGELMVPDSYGESSICNLYFDTQNYRLVRESIERPVYKEKLRLRCYGIPNDESTAFVELKKKFKGVVYKRRVDMKYVDAYNYLVHNAPPPEHSQIINEIDYFKAVYSGVAPAMMISYNRVAMFHRDDPNLRITFDRDIMWRTDRLDLREGNLGKRLLDEGEIIMEIKIPEAFPLWLVSILDELRIFPHSYSKYGNAYKTVLRTGLSEEFKTLNDRIGVL